MLRSSPAVFAIAPVVVVATLAGWLGPFQNALDDVRFRLTSTDPSGQIVLADIDAKSIQAEGRWPWRRALHAGLIENLRELGASEIVFDVDFSARSDAADDAVFADALRRADGTVILAALMQKATADPGDARILHNEPIAALRDHAWIASADVSADADGKVRRLRYADNRGGRLTPSIAALLGGGSGIADQDFRIDFGIRADRFDRIPVIDLLRGDVAGDRVAGKKVIIGASAVELRDYFTVPVHGTISGSALQAIAAESIMKGRALQPTGTLISIIGVLAISLLIPLLFGRLKWFQLLGVLFLLSASIEAAGLAIQKMLPVLPGTAPLLAAVLGLALVTLLREIDFRRILLLIARNQATNAQTLLDRVIADNFAGVVVVDAAGTIRAASRAASQLLGTSFDLVGRTSTEILPPELADVARCAIDRAHEADRQETHHGEIGYPRRDGSPVILEYAVTASRLSGGLTPTGRHLPDSLIATVTFSDVTEERLAANKIAYMAEYDSLTGLPNRNQLHQRLAGALQVQASDAEGCAVVCFDLDRFKSVNDTLGHDVGDLLLKAVAERASALIAPGDLLGRLGGDEFVVVCSGGNAKARAVQFCETLLTRTGEPFDLDGHRLIAGMSFGVAPAASSERDPLVVLKQADIALYATKASGGNGVSLFTPEMSDDLQTRHALEFELWEAVMQRKFEVFYQPQVDLVTGGLVGMEALLRWNNPKFGAVSPADFIPVAEALGLIQPLGDWVLEKACSVAATWPAHVKLAVNVSSIQFVRGDLVKSVARALDRAGLPPHRLEIEITESLFLQENQLIRATLRQLQELGVTLALDDFGTGYSALSYLRRFRVDKIKIDRSFISDMPLNSESMAIVRAIASLAESLEVRLSAEGVETPAQLEFLRLLGCDEGQGFLFGRAISEDEVSGMMSAARPIRSLAWAS